MTTAQVVETSVTVINSSCQNYTHPDDHTRQTTDTPGFKPLTITHILSTMSNDRSLLMLVISLLFSFSIGLRHEEELHEQ